MATVSVKTVPNARKTEVVCVVDSVVKIKVCAPAVEGKANAALVKFLADTFEVAKSRVRILRGETGRLKVLEIDGVDDAFERLCALAK